MRLLFFSLLPVIFLMSFGSGSFKDEQMRYPRVREAFSEKGEGAGIFFKRHEINITDLNIYLRAFKSEETIELWAKNKEDDKFILVKEYKFCANSGKIGPKRQEGDLQIPEGFYYIDRFNPQSMFHLSLGINYPNQSDRILGVSGKLGGDIFIHGACATIGCIPITDDLIKELYVYCVMAKDNGQDKIPVDIFPAKLEHAALTELIEKNASDKGKTNLWEDLRKRYDHFNETHSLPQVIFLKDGRHRIEKKI